MKIITHSNPEDTIGTAKLQAIAVSKTHVKLLIDDKIIYESKDVSDCDMWDSFEYNGKPFDLHINFSEDIKSCEDVSEWLTTCYIEICGLEEVSGHIQTYYDHTLKAPMSFVFDPMTLFN